MSTYCDSCLTAAYDEVGGGIEEQTTVLDLVADMLPDHLCDRIDEPDIRCDCAAHRRDEVKSWR